MGLVTQALRGTGSEPQACNTLMPCSEVAAADLDVVNDHFDTGFSVLE